MVPAALCQQCQALYQLMGASGSPDPIALGHLDPKPGTQGKDSAWGPTRCHHPLAEHSALELPSSGPILMAQTRFSWGAQAEKSPTGPPPLPLVIPGRAPAAKSHFRGSTRCWPPCLGLAALHCWGCLGWAGPLQLHNPKGHGANRTPPSVGREIARAHLSRVPPPPAQMLPGRASKAAL